MATRRNSYNERLFKAILEGKGKESVIRASKYRKAVERSKSESEIQQECIRWFKENYPQLAQEGMLFHIANEGIRLGGMGARFKREGIVKGVADLCLAIPRHGYGALYIEMKRPGTYQRPEQKAWQQAVEKYGSKYVVCRSVQEFIVEVNRYLSL
jgi:hypothetical protein